MLILVSVTVTLAINGGLFDYAKTAAEGTNQAAEEEKALSSGTVLIRNGAVNEEVDIGTFYNE